MMYGRAGLPLLRAKVFRFLLYHMECGRYWILRWSSLTILSALDILQLMRWNYLYAFVTMYIMATFARVAFHLVVQVQNVAREGKHSPLESTLMQPAFKPLDKKERQDDE